MKIVGSTISEDGERIFILEDGKKIQIDSIESMGFIIHNKSNGEDKNEIKLMFN